MHEVFFTMLYLFPLVILAVSVIALVAGLFIQARKNGGVQLFSNAFAACKLSFTDSFRCSYQCLARRRSEIWRSGAILIALFGVIGFFWSDVAQFVSDFRKLVGI
jgi:hypothetical protein